MSSSPGEGFAASQWVRGEDFYGRGDQVAEILDGPRNAIWLLGARRVGKTSLLKQLELLAARPERGYFPLYWDFQGAEEVDELGHRFDAALLAAGGGPGELGIVDAAPRGDFFASLGRLRRLLRGQKRSLLLLCDGAEELIRLRERDPSLPRKLRRAIQSQEAIRAVLASSIRLWELAQKREDTSPFLHGFIPPLYVRPLCDDEAEALLRQAHLPSEARPVIDDEAVAAIRQRADNHPYLLRLVARRFLELGDVDEACEQVAADPAARCFFANDFEALSETEREILRYVARQRSVGSRSIQSRLSSDSGSASGGLQRLESLGFLRRDAQRRFTLANVFFRRWLETLPPPRPATRAEPTQASEGADAPTETALSYRAAVEKIDDRYELVKEVGKGASGVVYQAWDTFLETRVALKLLKAEYAASRKALDRVRQEILLSRDLAHPNILRVYHLGASETRVYLTMRWIEGPTLGRLIAEDAPLAPARTVAIGAKLASALAAAHRRQVLHRDVKPSNVLLDEAGEPYLADFGLARLIGSPGITSPGLFLGTPYYASPEQAELRPLDGRSDLYSLGLMLFEMITGQRPFQAKSSRELLEMRRLSPAPDPREIEPELPARLAEIVHRAIERDPADRFRDAEALESALRRVAEALG